MKHYNITELTRELPNWYSTKNNPVKNLWVKALYLLMKEDILHK